MESDPAERCRHGYLLLFSAESLSAWQCTASCGLIGKLHPAHSLSWNRGPERKQAYDSENCCRGAGNPGRCACTTVIIWPVRRGIRSAEELDLLRYCRGNRLSTT